MCEGREQTTILFYLFSISIIYPLNNLSSEWVVNCAYLFEVVLKTKMVQGMQISAYQIHKM